MVAKLPVTVLCAGSITLMVFLVNACFLHSDRIDFNSQVKPIINKKCITCHGGVRAKGGFSLLFREEAFAKTESGQPAIIAGDPDHSELMRRITSNDPAEKMPYKHEPLTKEEIKIFREWIRQGAPWGQHWAYAPVTDPALPSGQDGWIHNDIDRYILERLKEEGLSPAAAAAKPALLRRVSLDLTGIYPSAAVARQFLESKDPGAYGALVDSLLASPHFGEKWAAMWLDLARYADTKGYERDDSRNIWRYRDWLIRAFNADMPYDRFITEQIAGDLLPDPTDADLTATGFHRNTMTNDEGGTDNEEFRTAAVLDRVNTTWEAMMGTTFACTQCHSHPYDPFHHEDYYRFMAYFNDTRDEDTEADYPLLRNFSDSDRVRMDSVITWVRKESGDIRAKAVRRLLRTWQPSINSLNADHFVNGELNDTKWLAFRQAGSARLRAVDLTGKSELIYRWLTFVPGGTWEIHLDSVKGKVIGTAQTSVTKDWTIASMDLPRVDGVHDLYLTYHNPKLTKPGDNGIIYDWFCFTNRFPGESSPGYAARKATFWELLTKKVPTTPVMMDNPADMHRVSNVFERGNWLVKGEVVTPGVPQSLADCMPAGAPSNRLGLAMWMTSKKNPLTSRTIVNRIWEQLFGMGIIETVDDLGTQGSPPTHQALLDHLSWQFMNEDGWSMKRLIKDIVMSATYQEDSRVSPASLRADPFDRLYSRGARVRLSAEQLRDQDLCICGQMNPAMFGPSVFPFQPKGIWNSPWNGAEWVTSTGGEQYRRALYTYWKRTASYPSMITFDATSREVCTARRIRTNTPLQALVTLNDSVYLDMARQLARRIDSSLLNDPSRQIDAAYQAMLFKPVDPQTLRAMLGLYKEALEQFNRQPEKAEEILGLVVTPPAVAAASEAGARHVAGKSAAKKGAVTATLPVPPPPVFAGTPMAEHPRLAALVVVANAMLNLDEVITKN